MGWLLGAHLSDNRWESRRGKRGRRHSPRPPGIGIGIGAICYLLLLPKRYEILDSVISSWRGRVGHD